ncbi:MAG: hypothetical protein DMD75_15885 [Candidatus Rokuibacteriota bacterium]|nr:MAG: hypothetical protein DMD75_15885 [Candidatus Rokubacteria bacterium]
MSETPKLLLQKDGPIGWIIFNQPEKRNAVSLEMWQLMPDYVQDLANDDAIRVVVLRGAGDQAFVAGADISQFKERRRNMADQEEYGRISARGQDALGTLTKPLLAMIHGYCVGGGVGIAIGCDMRIASDDARFGIPAARLGLGYHYKGMEKLMKLVGPAYTKEIFFTARTDFSAQDALGTLTKPLLAMIHGYCVGGGVGIAIGCDMRIASDDARFGIPAARLGLGYHYKGMEKLMKLVGPAYTKEIFFTARTDFSAQDALRMGLVNQVVPKAELETFTRNYALTMARNAPRTLRSAKATVEQLVRPDGERDLAMLEKLIADCFNSQDYQEGVKAFSEKRRPQFQGR